MRLPQFPIVEQAHPHTAYEWAARFGDPAAQVTAWIDWARIGAMPDAHVAEVLLDSREAIGDLATLWYREPGGTARVPWLTRGAVRTTIAEAMQLQEFPSLADVTTVRRFTEMVSDTPKGTVLTIPAWLAGNGDLVILDGTHRTCAIWQSGHDIQVRVLMITNVTDPLAIPDVMHDTHAQVDDAAWFAMYERVRANFTA